MIQLSHLTERRSLVPFVWTAVAWLVVGGLVQLYQGTGETGLRPFYWFCAFWALSMLNLFLLLKVVASLLIFVSENEGSKKAVTPLSLALWTTAKIAGLGLLVFTLLRSDQASVWGVVFGLGAFIVVPLLGGLWWSRGVLAQESADYAW